MRWNTTDLGSICRLINGKAFKPSDWTEEGEPIIRIQNLNDSAKPFNYWAGSLDKEVLVKPGDLLFAWSGTPGTSFGAHIWNGPSGVLNQHIFRVDLDESVVDKKWWAGAVNFQLNELIGQAHGGVGLKHVTKGMVDRLEIPLPPLDEQKRIAAILDQADALRRLRTRALDRLNALGQAIFHEMFGDTELNQRGLERATLNEIIRFVGGNQPPKSNFLYEDGPDRVRFVQTRDFRTDAYKTYLPTALARRPFVKDDVMIGRYGPPVFQIFRGLSGTYNVALMKAEPRADISKNFVFFLLQEPKLHGFVVSNSERTAGQSGVNLELLEAYEAFLPSRKIIEEFDSRTTIVAKQIECAQIAVQLAESLFTSLQHRAFRGEL